MNKVRKLLICCLVLCMSVFFGVLAVGCNDDNKDTTPSDDGAAVTYTVTFDVQGHGTAPDAQTVDKNGNAQKPATDPSAKNWIFDGWFKEAAGTTAFDFNTPITANTTVYAKWTAAPAVPTTTEKVMIFSDDNSAIANQSFEETNKKTGGTITYHYNIVTLAAGEAKQVTWKAGTLEAGTTYKIDIRSEANEQDTTTREGIQMWIQDASVDAGDGTNLSYYWTSWASFGVIGAQVSFTQDELDKLTSPGGTLYNTIIKNTTDSEMVLHIVCSVGNSI